MRINSQISLLKKVPQTVAPATQEQSTLKKLEQAVAEEVGDGVQLAAEIPLLKRFGYWLYGLFTRPKSTDPILPNIGTLSPNLLRSAQPTEPGFAALKQQGVQTIINLRPEEEWEKPIVERQGMKYIYLPLPAVGAPSQEQALAFLSTVTDPANGKVLFHCQHGRDRTGAMAAAYRIAVQGWSLDQAVAEMQQYGFTGGFEEDKLDFVKEFAANWSQISSEEKAVILHRSLNTKA